MKRCLFVLAAPALCLFVSSGAFADDKTTDAKSVVRPTGQLMGMHVQNTKNETLGHVEDYVIDFTNGKTVYVAMARGQFAGFGGSLFAIAPEALSMSPNGEYMILDATNQDFDKATGFDLNAWPTQPDRRWGKPTGVVVANKENLARVNVIHRLYVNGRENKSLGRIYDLAMTCPGHQVIYAAVQQGGTLGFGGKLIAVPWQALTLKMPTLDPQRRAFFLDATAQEFQNATGFTSDRWPEQPNTTFKAGRRD
jgi:sporulation protein YlmC with PRC-barrel domain